MTNISPAAPVKVRHIKRVRSDKRQPNGHCARMEARILYLEDQLAAARDWIKHLIKQQEAARAPSFTVSRETKPSGD